MTLRQIAEAVVLELNSRSWSLSFTAERHYRARYEMADLESLRVAVSPRSVQWSASHRAGHGGRHGVDIAIQQRLPDEALATIDPLEDFVEEVATYFRYRRLQFAPSVVCVEVAVDPVYEIDQLDELRVFSSAVGLTCQRWEP